MAALPANNRGVQIDKHQVTAVGVTEVLYGSVSHVLQNSTAVQCVHRTELVSAVTVSVRVFHRVGPETASAAYAAVDTRGLSRNHSA